MRINLAAVALFFLIAISSQGSTSCFFLNKLKSDSTSYNDDYIFDFDPICRKVVNKLYTLFSKIFPNANGVSGILGGITKRPDSSVGAGTASASRPPNAGNGTGALSTGVSLRPPGAVGGVITRPPVPNGDSGAGSDSKIETIEPTGASGAADDSEKPPPSNAEPAIPIEPIIPTAGLDVVTEDDDDIVSIDNDDPPLDYDASVENHRFR
ncbi:uncharacterized protein [Eurosta solidaginis]|uniref:uncharacterized protein n=1 Tax=Eurosta solidaginis TaxID=178769 RepID=UPI0035308885